MNEKITKKIEEVIGGLAQEFMRQDIPDDITKIIASVAGTFFLQGVEWQKEQFENNRLSACDSQTEEEAQREMDFAMNIIKKEHRQPTYSDAIEYGMRVQKEKIIDKACEKINEIMFKDGSASAKIIIDKFRKAMEAEE